MIKIGSRVYIKTFEKFIIKGTVKKITGIGSLKLCGVKHDKDDSLPDFYQNDLHYWPLDRVHLLNKED